ncbi:hypothetical protein BU16DRAFT_562459 [Lophium mytilinum]|uniref:Uncharacterized protein n=1 Tax=Lophium mytilinum TaxID=390894 RepID=A0A6A6QRN3_9PEZI|nr:hypothetical protein BU16DRAFT_562459 [Lophium mytilinum]
MSTEKLPLESTNETVPKNHIPTTGSSSNVPAESSKSAAKRILSAPVNLLAYIFPEVDYTIQGTKYTMERRRKSQLQQASSVSRRAESTSEMAEPPPPPPYEPPPYEPQDGERFRSGAANERRDATNRD